MKTPQLFEWLSYLAEWCQCLYFIEKFEANSWLLSYKFLTYSH